MDKLKLTAQYKYSWIAKLVRHVTLNSKVIRHWWFESHQQLLNSSNAVIDKMKFAAQFDKDD